MIEPETNVASMKIDAIEFTFNGHTVLIAGTKHVTYKNGTSESFPPLYEDLMSTLSQVPSDPRFV